MAKEQPETQTPTSSRSEDKRAPADSDAWQVPSIIVKPARIIDLVVSCPPRCRMPEGLRPVAPSTSWNSRRPIGPCSATSDRKDLCSAGGFLTLLNRLISGFGTLSRRQRIVSTGHQRRHHCRMIAPRARMRDRGGHRHSRTDGCQVL